MGSRQRQGSSQGAGAGASASSASMIPSSSAAAPESPAPSLGMFSSSPPAFESPKTVHKGHAGYGSASAYMATLASSPLEQRSTGSNVRVAGASSPPPLLSSPVRPMSALQPSLQPLEPASGKQSGGSGQSRDPAATLKRSFSSISDPETYQRRVQLTISKSGRAEIAMVPHRSAMADEAAALLARSREGLCIERTGSVATSAADTAATTVRSSSWDSDSEDDDDMVGHAGSYGPSEFVATSDAMTAFARTISRSRARTRHGGYSKTTAVVRTPKQPGSHQFFFAQASRGSHLAPSPISVTAESEALRRAAAAAAAVTDPSSTPPGNVLLLDDLVFTTGMTPYLPRSAR